MERKINPNHDLQEKWIQNLYRFSFFLNPWFGNRIFKKFVCDSKCIKNKKKGTFLLKFHLVTVVMLDMCTDHNILVLSLVFCVFEMHVTTLGFLLFYALLDIGQSNIKTFGYLYIEQLIK